MRLSLAGGTLPQDTKIMNNFRKVQTGVDEMIYGVARP